MIRRLAALALVLCCSAAYAQEGKTRRTEGVVFLRTSAPSLVDDLRVGDWWIDTDSGTAPPTAYILTDLTPTWTVLPGGGGGGAPTNAEYWVGNADATLSAEKNLGVLGTGLVINTGGVPSTYSGGSCAGAGYVVSLNSSGATTCNMPTLNDLIDPLLGDMLYSDAIHSWAVLGGNITTTKKFLTQTGTGAASAAPSWAAIGSVCTTPQFSRGVLDDTSALCAQPSFSEIAGAVSDSQVPNTITIDLAATATALAANGANCSAGSYPLGVDASGAVEGCTVAGGGTTHNLLSATHTDTVAASPTDGSLLYAHDGGLGVKWEEFAIGSEGDVLTVSAGLPSWVAKGTTSIAEGGTGQTTQTAAFDALAPTTTSGDLIYHNGTDNVRLPKSTAYQILRTSPTSGYPEWGHSVTPLAGNVGVAASASYTTVFSITPVASKANVIHFNVLYTASATTVGVQFRVLSADAGNVGNCFFTTHGIAGTAASAAAEEYDVIAIAAAPADTAAAASGFTAMNLMEAWCQFVSDGTPGVVTLEAQLETGTTSINILAGSYYTYIYN